MKLSVTMVVVIVVVVIVLLVIGSFFWLSSTRTVNTQTAQTYVAEHCATFKDAAGLTNNYIYTNYPEFSQACKDAYGMEPIECVTKWCHYTITRDACTALCRMSKGASIGPQSRTPEEWCDAYVTQQPDKYGACSCATALTLC